MKNVIENHEGKFCGIYTATQKGIHNAKVQRITDHTVLIEDNNDGSLYRYYLKSIRRLKHKGLELVG